VSLSGGRWGLGQKDKHKCEGIPTNGIRKEEEESTPSLAVG